MAGLASFTLLHKAATDLRLPLLLAPRLDKKQQFRLNRFLDAVRFGSGGDFVP